MKKPSNFIINICKTSLEVFETKKTEIGIVKKLTKIIVGKLEKNNVKLDQLECKEHVFYIIKLLLTTRIYKECKWLKEKSNSTKQQPKLRIFQHK